MHDVRCRCTNSLVRIVVVLMIEFKVEGRPVPQPRPRVYTTRSGQSRAVNSSKSKVYKRLVKLTAKSYMNRERITLTERPLSVALTFVFKPPKSYTKKKLEAIKDGKLRYTKLPDADNLAKSVMDSMNGVLYKDDSQIVELTVKKEYGVEDCLVVKVEELQ